MARFVFYCRDTLDNIESMEYYRQDIDALRALGHDVVICTRYRDIPKRFDAMFIWWWTYALVPILIARLRRRKAIVAGVFNFRFDDSASGKDYFSRPWHQRLLIRAATLLADANLFTSHREFDEVAQHFNLATAHYSPCAIGDDYFDARQADKPRTLLLNVSWSSPESLQRKGVWTIVDAAKILHDRGVCPNILLAGKAGSALPKLKQRICELGLEEYVDAVGEVGHKEKLDLFARTKIYLQPSRFEGFGLATAEAAAAGGCVITTDVGEVRTVMGDGAMYVQPGDAEGLANAIEKLLAEPRTVAALDARALDRLRKLFSPAGKRSNFANILQNLGIK